MKLHGCKDRCARKTPAKMRDFGPWSHFRETLFSGRSPHHTTKWLHKITRMKVYGRKDRCAEKIPAKMRGFGPRSHSRQTRRRPRDRQSLVEAPGRIHDCSVVTEAGRRRQKTLLEVDATARARQPPGQPKSASYERGESSLELEIGCWKNQKKSYLNTAFKKYLRS